MRKIRFLSYIAKTIGVKELDIPDELSSVSEILDFLYSTYPVMKDKISDLMVLMGEKTLILSKDMDLKVTDDLHITPIIAGG